MAVPGGGQEQELQGGEEEGGTGLRGGGVESPALVSYPASEPTSNSLASMQRTVRSTDSEVNCLDR